MFRLQMLVSQRGFLRRKAPLCELPERLAIAQKGPFSASWCASLYARQPPRASVKSSVTMRTHAAFFPPMIALGLFTIGRSEAEPNASASGSPKGSSRAGRGRSAGARASAIVSNPDNWYSTHEHTAAEILRLAFPQQESCHKKTQLPCPVLPSESRGRAIGSTLQPEMPLALPAISANHRGNNDGIVWVFVLQVIARRGFMIYVI